MGKKCKEFQLLVEGKNDQHVIWNLAQKLSLKETFEVENSGGKSHLSGVECATQKWW